LRRTINLCSNVQQCVRVLNKGTCRHRTGRAGLGLIKFTPACHGLSRLVPTCRTKPGRAEASRGELGRAWPASPSPACPMCARNFSVMPVFSLLLQTLLFYLLRMIVCRIQPSQSQSFCCCCTVRCNYFKLFFITGFIQVFSITSMLMHLLLRHVSLIVVIISHYSNAI